MPARCPYFGTQREYQSMESPQEFAEGQHMQLIQELRSFLESIEKTSLLQWKIERAKSDCRLLILLRFCW